MIGYKYIYEPIPYNRELDSEIGVDYANDGKSIRFDPIRVDVENWTEEINNIHDCISHGDCARCSSNEDFDREIIEIRVGNKSYEFVRTKSHQLGGVWSNWYDNTYAISPVK